MKKNRQFFESQDPQAVLKHGVIGRYASYFAVRAGSRGKPVLFIDGFAGEGRYEDGTPGSPLLLLSEAERAKLFDRDVSLICVESDVERADLLATNFATHRQDTDSDDISIEILPMQFGEALPLLKSRAVRKATLVFIDPFGLTLSFDEMMNVLKMGGRGGAVDVIFHFSLRAVSRMAPATTAADTPDAARAASIEQLDTALGPVQWREIFGAERNSDASRTDQAIECCRQYAERAAAECGMKATTILVRKRPGHAPIYSLTLFSRDPQAHWDYVDMAGNAYVDWLYHCDKSDYEAALEINESDGALKLFEDEAPDRGDIDTQLGAIRVPSLAENIRRLLSDRGSLVPQDSIELIYGTDFGLARSTHVRQALQRLHKSKQINDDGKGRYFFKREITYTGTD